MKKVATASGSEDLSLEERNLLSVAYKNVVGARRASLRIIGSIESKEKGKDPDKVNLISTYKATVEEELNKICQDILSLLDQSLIKTELASEPAVFYQKMKARALRPSRSTGRPLLPLPFKPFAEPPQPGEDVRIPLYRPPTHSPPAGRLLPLPRRVLKWGPKN